MVASFLPYVFDFQRIFVMWTFGWNSCYLISCEFENKVFYLIFNLESLNFDFKIREGKTPFTHAREKTSFWLIYFQKFELQRETTLRDRKIGSKYGGVRIMEVRIRESNLWEFINEFSRCQRICSIYGGVRIRGSRITESLL